MKITKTPRSLKSLSALTEMIIEVYPMGKSLILWMTVICFSYSQAFAFTPVMADRIVRAVKRNNMGGNLVSAKSFFQTYYKQMPAHLRLGMAQAIKKQPDMNLLPVRIQKVQSGKDTFLRYTVTEGNSSLVLTMTGKSDIAATIVGNIGRRQINLKLTPEELMLRPEWLVKLTNGDYQPPASIHFLTYQQWRTLKRDDQKKYLKAIANLANLLEKAGVTEVGAIENPEKNKSYFVSLFVSQAFALDSNSKLNGTKCFRANWETVYKDGVCGKGDPNLNLRDGSYGRKILNCHNPFDARVITLESDAKGRFGTDQTKQCLDKMDFSEVTNEDQYNKIRDEANKQFAIYHGVCGNQYRSYKSRDLQQTCWDAVAQYKSISAGCDLVARSGKFPKLQCTDKNLMAAPSNIASTTVVTDASVGESRQLMTTTPSIPELASMNNGLYPVYSPGKGNDGKGTSSIQDEAARLQQQQFAAAQAESHPGASATIDPHQTGNLVNDYNGTWKAHDRNIQNSETTAPAAAADASVVTAQNPGTSLNAQNAVAPQPGVEVKALPPQSTVVVTSLAPVTAVTAAPAQQTAPAPNVAASTAAPAALAAATVAATTPAAPAAATAPVVTQPVPVAATTSAPTAPTAQTATVVQQAPAAVAPAPPAATTALPPHVAASPVPAPAAPAQAPAPQILPALEPTKGVPETAVATSWPRKEDGRSVYHPDTCVAMKKVNLECDGRKGVENAQIPITCADGTTAQECTCPSRGFQPIYASGELLNGIVIGCHNIEREQELERKRAEEAEEKSKAEAKAKVEKREFEAAEKKRKHEREMMWTIGGMVILGGVMMWGQHQAQKSMMDSYTRMWSAAQNNVGTPTFAPTPTIPTTPFMLNYSPAAAFQ